MFLSVTHEVSVRCTFIQVGWKFSRNTFVQKRFHANTTFIHNGFTQNSLEIGPLLPWPPSQTHPLPFLQTPSPFLRTPLLLFSGPLSLSPDPSLSRTAQTHNLGGPWPRPQFHEKTTRERKKERNVGSPESATFGVNASRVIPLLTFTDVNNNSISILFFKKYDIEKRLSE